MILLVKNSLTGVASPLLMNKSWVLIILSIILFFVYNNKFKVIDFSNSNITLPSIGSETFDIKKIRVIDGNEFEITYTSGKSIHGVLQVKTKDSAKDKVIKFLNESTQPKAVVFNKLNDVWIIDIVVSNNVSLTSWLKEQELILE